MSNELFHDGEKWHLFSGSRDLGKLVAVCGARRATSTATMGFWPDLSCSECRNSTLEDPVAFAREELAAWHRQEYRGDEFCEVWARDLAAALERLLDYVGGGDDDL